MALPPTALANLNDLVRAHVKSREFVPDALWPPRG